MLSNLSRGERNSVVALWELFKEAGFFDPGGADDESGQGAQIVIADAFG